MGKIEISEDLRNKLNKVLSYKSADIGDMPVGPAPSWKPPLTQAPQAPQTPQTPQAPQAPQAPQTPQAPQISQQSCAPLIMPQMQTYFPIHQQPQYSYIKPEKIKRKKQKIKYLKITKLVFLSSIVAGIGVTLGLKIANILFF